MMRLLFDAIKYKFIYLPCSDPVLRSPDFSAFHIA